MKTKERKRPISLVSGVVARSREGRKNTEVERQLRAHQYRQGLSNALLQARAKVSPSEVAGFFEEMRRLTNFENKRFAPVPTGYSYLALLQSTGSRSLKFEVHWLSWRLLAERELLSQFVSRKWEIEQLIAMGSFAKALAEIEAIEDVAGVSLWSVSLTIALLQELGGDDAQKEYTSRIRARFKKAVLPVCARHLSQRAEKSVPIGWYVENTARRLVNRERADIQLYLQYRLTGAWPNGERDVAAILRVEQNHHAFDMYETFIGALQRLAVSSTDVALRQRVKDAVSRLEILNDFRLDKLSAALGLRSVMPNCEVLDSRALDLALLGQYRSAYREATNPSIFTSRSIATTLVASLLQSVMLPCKWRSRDEVAGLELRVSKALAIQSEPFRLIGSADSADMAWKIGSVYSGLPFALATVELYEAQRSSSPQSYLEKLKLAALNCQHISVLDVVANAASPIVARQYLDRLSPSATRDWALMMLDRNSTSGHSLEEHAMSFARGCSSYNAGKYEEVGTRIAGSLRSPVQMLARTSAMIALSAYGVTGDLRSAIDLLSNELSAVGRNPDSLPIQLVFEGIPWRDMSPLAEGVGLSNALAALGEIDTSDKTRTNRIFALQKVLAAHGIDRPSLLPHPLSAVKPEEVVYFLRNACGTDVLDMLRTLPSSKAVLEERRDIYALLVQLDPINAKEYKYQLATISKEIRVNQGLKTIDASRVHVDIAALRSILRRDLADSFNRYLQLSKDGESPAETFDSLLRELAKPELAARLWLNVQESEADELLISMVNVAKGRFLFDVPHGLDSYLSKRIRHGSIVGYLRAPVEAEGLITQQYSDGRYKENTRWERAVAQSRNPLELQAAFLAFTRAYDNQLLRLKDVVLHVRTEEKPKGIFDPRMGAAHYRLFRAVARTDTTIETFLDTVLSSLRGLLNPSLELARDLIAKDASNHFGTLFAQLKKAIEANVDLGPDRSALLKAVNQASTEVQRAITTVAGWFAPIEVEDVRFSMEDVCDIAKTIVQSLNPGFNPTVTIDDKSALAFDVQQLPFMQDIMLVAIGNVAKWSNLKAPKIHIFSDYSAEASALTLEVSNEAEFPGGIAGGRSRVLEVQPRLNDPAYLERARQDKDSGIPKLASIVSQSEHGRLSVEVRDDERFYLNLVLSIHQEEPKDANPNSGR